MVAWQVDRLLLVLESNLNTLACLNEDMEGFELIDVGHVDCFQTWGRVSGKWWQSKSAFVHIPSLKHTPHRDKWYDGFSSSSTDTSFKVSWNEWSYSRSGFFILNSPHIPLRFVEAQFYSFTFVYLLKDEWKFLNWRTNSIALRILFL